jgi:hypothetical protein
MASIEERITALENEVARLRTQLQSRESATPRPETIGRTRPDFLQHYTRRSANSPMFDEVANAVAAERDKEREAARRLAEIEESNA